MLFWTYALQLRTLDVFVLIRTSLMSLCRRGARLAQIQKFNHCTQFQTCEFGLENNYTCSQDKKKYTYNKLLTVKYPLMLIFKVVKTKFEWLWKTLKDHNNLDSEVRNSCFLAALTMIHLIYKSQMSDITQQQKILLCYALLPECDNETKGCSGLDLLKEAFPNGEK